LQRLHGFTEIVVSVRKITLHTIPEAPVHTVVLMVVLRTILVVLAHTVALTADLFLLTILVAIARFLEPLPELMKRPKP
jgi:hypothetical protein